MELSNVFDLSNVLVYVSGVRMPASSVSVTSAFNAFPACTVTLPPDSRLFGIGRRDRVPLHIFVENVFCGAKGAGSYIMMFEGEVVSFGYSSTGTGRDMVLNGRSNMCFLDDVDLRVLVGLDDFAAAMVPGEHTSSINVVGGVAYPMSLVMTGVSAVNANSIIKYPYGFIENVAKFLSNTGVAEPVPESKVFNYYKEYSARLKFSQRFPRVPYFDDANAPWGASGFPILSGIQKAAAVQHLTGTMSNGPNIRSLYSVLDYVASRMEYELSVFASPTLVGNVLSSIALKPILYEAMPPRCNIIFRSHCQSLRTQEQVYKVPTRVRIKDTSGALAQISHGQDAAIVQFGISDYYPKELPNDSTPAKRDPFAEELLSSEKYTGPYAYEALPPDWMSYIDPKMIKESSEDYKENILRHMLTLKNYEGRGLECSTGLNPFYTPGFPGVVFDTTDTGFSFIGQVMSVSHNITKRGAGTSVSMSFVRTLTEELATPLPNSLKVIDSITKDNPGAMDAIYSMIIGCTAVPLGQLPELLTMAYNDDPSAAYLFNQRQIVDLTGYLKFLGNGNAVAEEVTLPNGTKVPSVLSGPNFGPDRKDPGIVDVLKELGKESVEGAIYA